MAPNIILVTGVSGVGKTTLCRLLKKIFPNIRHIVASSYIDSTRDIDQLALARRIHSVALAYNSSSLVDGHLITGGGKVPREAVVALAPKAIVVVIGDPRDIVARRAADDDRARPVLDEDKIACAQDAELEWARELAQTIGIPLIVADGGDDQGLQSEILHLLEDC